MICNFSHYALKREAKAIRIRRDDLVEHVADLRNLDLHDVADELEQQIALISELLDGVEQQLNAEIARAR